MNRLFGAFLVAALILVIVPVPDVIVALGGRRGPKACVAAAAGLAVLGATLVVVDFAIDGPIGYFAGTLRERIGAASPTSTHRVNLGAAAVFAGLAGWLAATS